MRNRGHVLDKTHLETRALERSDRRLPACAGAFYVDLDLSHTESHCLLGCDIGSYLSCIRRAFSGTPETLSACRGPGNNVAALVCNGYNCIIE